MDNVILFILLGHVSHVEAVLQLEPRTLTVLRGHSARLTCSTAQPWEVMVWSLNTSAVLTISAQYGILSNNPNVTAVDHSSGTLSSWEFVLKRTEWSHQGHVTCDLQNIQRESASLFVQEGGSVGISGGDVTALRGQRVVFECQALGWYPEPRLTWRVNGREVGEGEHNISAGVSGDRLYNLTSDLIIQALESSHVECLASVSALSTPLASSVRLTVVAEVHVEENDCTALVAGTVSVSTVLLLLLASLCSVLCYRRRRAKSSQPDAIRIDQSESGRSSVAEATGGKVNLGYTTERHTDIGHIDLTQGTHSQTDSLSTHKVPDVVSSSNLSLHSQSTAQMDMGGEGSKTIRRITTV